MKVIWNIMVYLRLTKLTDFAKVSGQIHLPLPHIQSSIINLTYEVPQEVGEGFVVGHHVLHCTEDSQYVSIVVLDQGEQGETPPS